MSAQTNKRKLSNEEFESEEEDSGQDLSQDEDSEELDSDEDEMEEESDEPSDEEADISQMTDNIQLKDISDDELSLEEVNDEDVSDYMSQVLQTNDSIASNQENTTQNVQSISNDIVPNERGHNLAHVDEYEHDSSDEEDVLNTIGNIPYEWYKDYVHIGYDVNGRKIIKPPKEDEIDEFLRKMDDPTYWRTVKDHLTGQKVILTDDDANLIKRLKSGKFPEASYDPYEPFIDFFTYEKMIHPVTNRPETKASFIPSLSEKRIVSKLVSAIKKSRLKPKPPISKPKPFEFAFDLWQKDGEHDKRRDRYIPAPKLKPPGHEESYNPPPEYLFTEEEKKEWQDMEAEERKINFIPRSFSSLRQVPAYPEFIKERFDRCLDLYLCPRARKNRIQVNPEDLIPELPKPADLQPFPAIQSLVYVGHEAPVVSISPDPSGQYLVSGDKSGVVKIWEVLTGRCFKSINLEDGAIVAVNWCPIMSKSIIAVATAFNVYIVNAGIGNKQIVSQTDAYLKGDGDEAIERDGEDNSIVEWKTVDDDKDEQLWKKGVRIVLNHKLEITQFSWHSAGEYFTSLMPTAANRSVIIHHLTKRKSQIPFKKSKDTIQCVQFHPTRAYFFVATKKSIRIYDLIKQTMTKKLMMNCSEVSCLAIHPKGDNVIVGSIDPRVQWFDLDLSNKAYKTLRYHKKAIRSIEFHRKYAIFASASDDGTVVVSHAMVYDDLLKNALIVPVKVLKAQNVKLNTPVLDCAFHPNQPWLFACSDNIVSLFT